MKQASALVALLLLGVAPKAQGAELYVDGEYFGPQETVVVAKGMVKSCDGTFFLLNPGDSRYGASCRNHQFFHPSKKALLAIRRDNGAKLLLCKDHYPRNNRVSQLITCTAQGWKVRNR